MWLIKCKPTKMNLPVSSLVALAIFQMFTGHLQLMATVLDSADLEHFLHQRKFHWAVLF